MPQECTWIMTRVEVCSIGDCTPYVPIHGATAVGHVLASDEVIVGHSFEPWEFILGCWDRLWKELPQKVR